MIVMEIAGPPGHDLGHGWNEFEGRASRHPGLAIQALKSDTKFILADGSHREVRKGASRACVA